jgi:hypothetical protein
MRFNVVKEMYNGFLNNLIVQGFYSKKSLWIYHEILCSPNASFATIDGTEYAKEIFDLVIFLEEPMLAPVKSSL